MPVYDYRCKHCGKTITERKPVEQRNQVPTCCKRPSERVLSAPMGYVDRPAAG
jgi:putative FmdB family regulatory protein